MRGDFPFTLSVRKAPQRELHSEARVSGTLRDDDVAACRLLCFKCLCFFIVLITLTPFPGRAEAGGVGGVGSAYAGEHGNKPFFFFISDILTFHSGKRTGEIDKADESSLLKLKPQH